MGEIRIARGPPPPNSGPRVLRVRRGGRRSREFTTMMAGRLLPEQQAGGAASRWLPFGQWFRPLGHATTARPKPPPTWAKRSRPPRVASAHTTQGWLRRPRPFHAAPPRGGFLSTSVPASDTRGGVQIRRYPVRGISIEASRSPPVGGGAGWRRRRVGIPLLLLVSIRFDRSIPAFLFFERAALSFVHPFQLRPAAGRRSKRIARASRRGPCGCGRFDLSSISTAGRSTHKAGPEAYISLCAVDRTSLTHTPYMHHPHAHPHRSNNHKAKGAGAPTRDTGQLPIPLHSTHTEQSIKIIQ